MIKGEELQQAFRESSADAPGDCQRRGRSIPIAGASAPVAGGCQRLPLQVVHASPCARLNPKGQAEFAPPCCALTAVTASAREPISNGRMSSGRDENSETIGVFASVTWVATVRLARWNRGVTANRHSRAGSRRMMQRALRMTRAMAVEQTFRQTCAPHFHAVVAVRFAEALGPPQRVVGQLQHWSLRSRRSTLPINVLLDVSGECPVAWTFDPHDVQSGVFSEELRDAAELELVLSRILGRIGHVINGIGSAHQKHQDGAGDDLSPPE